MVECTFELNNKPMSVFKCNSASFPAFSGHGPHVNRKSFSCVPGFGAIPVGVYYIIDRQSGGLLGPLRDLFTDRDEWFSLYAADSRIDDETFCDNVKRGQFRLHPKGVLGRSEGCIVIDDHAKFQQLNSILRGSQTIVIPGGKLQAYGRVTVK